MSTEIYCVLNDFLFHYWQSLSFNNVLSLMAREQIISEYRAYEKAYSSFYRNEMDVRFLKQCQQSKMVPKFIKTAKLPNSLSQLEKGKIRLKILKRQILSQSSHSDFLLNRLRVTRLNLWNVTGPRLFRRCVHWVVRNFLAVKLKKQITHDKKLANIMSESCNEKFRVEKTIINLTDTPLSDEETKILQFGMKHGIKQKLYWNNIKTNVEEFYQKLIQKKLIDESDTNIKSQLKTISQGFYNRNRNVSQHDHNILINLKEKGLKVCSFDKGNGTVVMTANQYKEKMRPLLEGSQFQKIKLRKNAIAPNIKLDEKFDVLLTKVTNRKSFLSDIFSSLKRVSSQPAKLYGLPKVHKPNIPMRPILSTVASMNHSVAQALDKILKPLINSPKVCKDTFSFVQEISQRTVSTQRETMVSFDVKSLFTMVPLEETIKLCVQLYTHEHGNNDQDLFEELLRLCVQNVPFMYDGEWWMQTDGVSMGSPLAPTLANIFMCYIEGQIEEHYSGPKPLYYTRYVDDTFAIFSSQNEIEPFLQFINTIHPNIEFTKEDELENKLSFLDVQIIRSQASYQTRQYFKPTDTGLYTTPFSQCDEKYKNSLIQNLTSRAWRIGSNYLNAITDIENNINRLKKCGYAENKIRSIVSKTVEKERSQQPRPKEEELPVPSIKLPFANGYKELRRKISTLFTTNTCKPRVIFETRKISSYFSNKCPTPHSISANIVYKFQCHGCDATYIGETKRHLHTRIIEHNQASRKSAIFDHNSTCNNRREKLNAKEFQIVAKNFKSSKGRKIHEAILINEHKPALTQTSTQHTKEGIRHHTFII